MTHPPSDFPTRNVLRIERDVDMLIEGSHHIVATGRNLPAPPGIEMIDAHGCVVISGLVNAHTHLYQDFQEATIL